MQYARARSNIFIKFIIDRIYYFNRCHCYIRHSKFIIDMLSNVFNHVINIISIIETNINIIWDNCARQCINIKLFIPHGLIVIKFIIENVSIMIVNNAISHKSSKNYSIPFENNIFNISHDTIFYVIRIVVNFYIRNIRNIG